MIIVWISIGVVVGFIGGSVGTKLSAERTAGIKVHAVHAIMQSLMHSNTTTMTSLTTALNVQERVIKLLRKDKVLLSEQLEEATEAMAELESMVEGEPEEESEEDEEDSGKVVTMVAAKSSANKAKVDDLKDFNKLVVIEGILKEAQSKQEVISPDTLLGIINHKSE